VSDTIANQVLLDSLGHAVLMFNSENKLVMHNIMAGTLLGADLNLIRDAGWNAMVQLFDSNLKQAEDALNVVRGRALTSDRPIRFQVYRSGEYLPCWAAALGDKNGNVFTLIMLDSTDWNIVQSVFERFNHEMRDAVQSTIGHITLINRTLYNKDDDPVTAKLARRLGGFSKLIAMHMKRAERLMGFVERLEVIRTGQIRTVVQESRTKINLIDFIEDFLESLDDPDFLDPETEIHDFRSRIKIDIQKGIVLNVSKRYLTFVLQEILRNAIMYSLRGTPIKIVASIKGNNAQIDIIDEGYGIREKDYERVFTPFERGRQPQIISEFGYGLALHLCRSEIVAMNGKMWFTTVENVSSTFSVLLPMVVETVSQPASSQSTVS
jgi:signal transduction histidine kinase